MAQPSEAPAPERKLVPRPAWLSAFEGRLGRAIPIHPALISGAKLVLVTPLLALSLWSVQRGSAFGSAAVQLALVALFFALDYLDGVVARERGLLTWAGAVFDRLTDYPLLLLVSWHAIDIVPAGLISAKLGIDLCLFCLFLLGRGSTENRLRTGTSYAALVGLLLLTQGVAPRFFGAGFVERLLWLNIAFSSVVALFLVGVLQARFVADGLSLANLLCGVFSMVEAARGRFDLSLVLLLLGAAFDGFDGAAARRWGGTRWGVYSDDVADAVNYGVAPGVAVYLALGGVEGVVLGVSYAVFTLARLVYFTLNKKTQDPSFFAGAPSTVGGICVLCGLCLFPHRAGLVGLLVGVACVHMVSFDTRHRHLGRSVAGHPGRLLWLVPVALGMLGVGLLTGPRGPAAVLLALVLAYAFLPSLSRFALALRPAR